MMRSLVACYRALQTIDDGRENRKENCLMAHQARNKGDVSEPYSNLK